MNKKIVCAFIPILLILLFLLTGCGGSQQQDSASPSRPAFGDSLDALSSALTEGAGREYEYEYVKATLKDNALTITILSGDAADRCPGAANGLCFDQPYPVSGLTGSYTDLFVGTMGNDVSPFVFLLTEQGAVECVPVGEALIEWAYGPGGVDPVFASLGELPGVSDVISFYEDTVSDEGGGYVTVFAVTAAGEEIDLSFPYDYARSPQNAPPSATEAMEILMADDPATNMSYLHEQGMLMMDAGETESLYGGYCPVIAVGTDHESEFVREKYFAVDPAGAIYDFDIMTQQWVPANMLANIYSNSQDYWDLFAIICEPNGHELNDIYSTGRVEEVFISDPMLSSDTPMILLPLKNDVNIRVELVDFTPEGEIISETVLADCTLSRGDLCAIYAKYMYDTSPLHIFATWQDGPSQFTAIWWAVGGGGVYGETYLEYITGFEEDSGVEPMG